MGLKSQITFIVSIIYCVFLANDVLAEDPYATSYPTATTVLAGKLVTFTCTIIEPASENQILEWFIEWDEDTEIIRLISATNSNMISDIDRPEFSGRGNYRIVYSNSTATDGTKTHKCSLIITTTTLMDNGYFGCTHQTPGNTHRTLLKDKVRLTIVPEPATDPECRLNKHQTIFILTCTSTGGMPLADLIWYEDGESRSDTRQMFNTIEDRNRNITTERVFVCVATQGNLEAGRCNITLPGDPVTSVTNQTPVITSTTPFVPVDKTDNTGAIVGGVISALILLTLLLLLLLLLFIRKRKKTREPEPTTETPIQELPTLEPASQTVEENPYGDHVTGATSMDDGTDLDIDDLEKPWKNNPDLLYEIENNEYSDDEISLTESAAAVAGVDEQTYANYTVPS